MPKDVSSGKATPPRKKRNRNNFELTTPEHKVETEEVICVITTSESEEEGEGEAAATATPPPKKRSKEVRQLVEQIWILVTTAKQFYVFQYRQMLKILKTTFGFDSKTRIWFLKNRMWFLKNRMWCCHK